MTAITNILNQSGRGNELRRQIFKYCLTNGDSTIPDIAHALKYSVPAVTKHIVDLCQMGYFIDHGKVEAKEGRPPNIYGVNANSCFFLGVDIHKYSLNIGIMNLVGDIVKCDQDKSFVFENTPETLEKICTKVKRFVSTICAENNNVTRSKITNTNVNIAGRVNPHTGYSYSYFNMGEEPLSEVISRNIDLNVTIDNDTRAMTYGEYTHLKNQSANNIICINIGYGVGMGIITEGKPYNGKSGYAGEFGHTSVFDNQALCRCGKTGCLETEASGDALCRKVLKKLSEGSESILTKTYKKRGTVSIYEIINAITKSEDMLCIEILEEIGMLIGRQIANLINIFNPDKIIITGLLANTGDYILNPIKMSSNKYALTLVSKDTEIVLSQLKLEAGLIGGCMLARDRFLGL